MNPDNTTKKAGTSLPQNCPELEQFIMAQTHLRAAALIIDDFTVHPLPQLTEKQRDKFQNLSGEIRSKCYEVLDDVENLQHMFFGPLFPL